MHEAAVQGGMGHDPGADESLAALLARLASGDEVGVDPSVVPTRFPSLDRALGGGMRRGDLMVLGADHGAGASALALALALRSTPRALLFTGEMQAERVQERAVAMTARVTMEALRLGTLDDPARLRIAEIALQLRSRMPQVVTLYRGGIDGLHRALDGSPASALVIVDGLEALLERDVERESALAASVLGLKRLALERNVVVLLLAHLPLLDRNRQNLRPRLTDFGAAGAIAVHADVVLALFREELYDADLAVTGAAELLVLKHRDGPLGYVDLYYDARHLRFEDMIDLDA